MTLRLVRDEPPKRKRRKWTRTPLLKPDEARRFRAAMRGLRDAFGTWECLAAAMDTNTHAISQMMNESRSVSGDVIVRAMRASGLTFAELIGSPIAADRCRACGRVRAA